MSVRVPGCQKLQMTVWHRMLYSCTSMATVDVKGFNQSINQSIFRVAYVTNSYHKDHARKKVNLEDKARIGE